MFFWESSILPQFFSYFWPLRPPLFNFAHIIMPLCHYSIYRIYPIYPVYSIYYPIYTIYLYILHILSLYTLGSRLLSIPWMAYFIPGFMLFISAWVYVRMYLLRGRPYSRMWCLHIIGRDSWVWGKQKAQLYGRKTRTPFCLLNSWYQWSVQAVVWARNSHAVLSLKPLISMVSADSCMGEKLARRFVR